MLDVGSDAGEVETVNKQLKMGMVKQKAGLKRNQIFNISIQLLQTNAKSC